MRYRKVFKYMRGYVNFHCIGGFQSEFVNDLILNGIKVWALKKDGEHLYASVFATDYKTTAKIAKRHHVKIRLEKKKGTIFTINKRKNRFGIAIGLLAFCFFLTFMSNYVWDIEVIGNESISSREILLTARDLGIRRGTFGPALDLRTIEQKTLLLIDDLSWVGINRHGSKITIDVRERIVEPDIVADDKPCNIVATKTGQILYTEVYSGQLLVPIGSSVLKGNIIVSGILEDEEGNTSYVHADAKIIAEYEEQIKFSIPFKRTEDILTGEVKKRNYITILGLDLPLFISIPLKDKYEYSEEVTKLKLFGVNLPISIRKTRYERIEQRHFVYNKEQANNALLQQISRYEESILKDVEIVEKNIEEESTDDNYEVIVDYVLKGNIAKKEEILLNSDN
ncbi:MAG: sporulation protein YqfD [Clostridiales bacterium]|nr:sporulation protein YqfD [Clostridiales bacterium]